MNAFKKLDLLACALACLCFISCNNDSSESSENSRIVGTKWVATNWDYSLGDDWVGLHNEYFQFFFTTSTEGICYYGRKDDYSDMDTSTKKVASHFKYSLQGNEITLDYITDQVLPNRPLILNENTLTTGDLTLMKMQMSSSDHMWINSICGKTGDCSWYSDMCGTIWIIGEGAMANYTSYSVTPWAKNNRTPNRVVVGEGVTTIGSYAFNNPSIANVEMPDRSLEKVGDAAFKESLIKTIWMSQSTTLIGEEAFAGCKYLEDINIPESIVSIGEYAFSGCALNEFQLVFGGNLRTIGNFAFEGGEASYMTLAEGVQSISTGAFVGDYCSISKELLLPNSLTSIGVTVFEGPYKKIVIGTGVTEIGEKAFISGATSGEMYVNLSTPPSVGNNIIVERTNWESAESRWTLYVPKGCKSAYSNKSPWNKFKSIIEDSTLQAGEGGGNNSGSDNDDGEEPSVKVDYKNLSYIADGKTYKMILVDGGTLPPFYLMQTEVPVEGYLQIGDTYIGTIDSNEDKCIIKAELRSFINKLRETTGLEFRLPTVAEWKFAAQGGAKSAGYTYSGSNDINEVAWYKSNSQGSSHDAATKLPNELGFYDMSGNLGEVCSDGHYDIDGYIYGGCWNDVASNCTSTSKKAGDKSANRIPGTKIKELNAVDGKYITIRLAYSIPD